MELSRNQYIRRHGVLEDATQHFAAQKVSLIDSCLHHKFVKLQTFQQLQVAHKHVSIEYPFILSECFRGATMAEVRSFIEMNVDTNGTRRTIINI